MPIPLVFQLPLLGPTGEEYMDSIDMTTVLGLRPLATGERPGTSASNVSSNQARDRKCQ